MAPPWADLYSRAVSSLEDSGTVRLRLAAEEVGWLTGRGYALDVVSRLVASHHGLSDEEQSALARGTCSEPQYRRRAARELETEDIARRPLAIDAVDAVVTVEAALAGEVLLQTLDGTVRAWRTRQDHAASDNTARAVEILLAASREGKPSVLRFFVGEGVAGAIALGERIVGAAKAQKVKAEVVAVPSVRGGLAKERQIVTSDAELLDACAGWYNLVGKVVESVAGAKIVRLQ